MRVQWPIDFPAQIRKATYLGSHWDYSLSTPVGDLFVTQQDGAPFAPGDTAHLALLRERLALVAGEAPA